MYDSNTDPDFKAVRREKILSTAFRLFTERKIDDVSMEEIARCVLRPPAVGGALSSGRGAVIERSAGSDHRPIISYIYLSSFRFIITV